LIIFNSAMTDKLFSPDAIQQRLMAIPAVQKFGYRVEELSHGRAVIVAPYDASLDGIYQCFHGGLLATLADSTGATAVLTVTGAETPMTTTDMNIRFLAPCYTDARATAHIIKAGRTLLISHVDIHDMEGRHVAVSQASYMRLRNTR
jgi:acyl-CoA thioesterase